MDIETRLKLGGIARNLATESHCRYCNFEGFKCNRDFEASIDEILRTLVAVYEAGQTAGGKSPVSHALPTGWVLENLQQLR